MRAGPRRAIDKTRAIRLAILAVALVVGAVLLLGPTWVRPIHAESGLPFDQLGEHPEWELF